MKIWEELSRKMIFEKYGRGVVEIRYRLPDGKEEDFFIKHETPYVRIIAVTQENEIIAVRKFCPGPAKVLLDPPAGYLKKGETPQDAAERELLEETGYKGKFKSLVITHETAYCDVTGYVMVETDCKQICEPKAEREFLEVVLTPINQFRFLLLNGGNVTSDLSAWYLGFDHLGLL